MTFTFEYTNDKGEEIQFTTNDTVNLKDSFDAEAFLFLNRLRTELKFSKKVFLMALKIFSDIKFSNHTTSSWCTEGTINQYTAPFFSAVSNAELRPRVKYLFRLSEKGVELYNLFDALLLVEEYGEVNAQEFIKGYIEFKQLS
jgi:hypothetical protein